MVTVEDLEARWASSEDLTDVERKVASARLQDALDLLRTRIEDLNTRVVADSVYARVVKAVCCDAVIRLLSNPEGFKSETDGNYIYERYGSLADGRLKILDEEWERLGVRQRVTVVHAGPKPPWEV